jgi:hypothetical protein
VGFKPHDPSVRAKVDSSCLTPRGHCDRQTGFPNHAKDRLNAGPNLRIHFFSIKPNTTKIFEENILRTTNSKRVAKWKSKCVTTGSQSASLSWCLAPNWGPRPDFCYWQTLAGLLMWCALSDERTGLSFTTAAGPRQRSHSRVRVPYCLRFETPPPTWRARSPYLYPPGTGWPVAY